jgi:hypothetical protein
MDIKNISPLVQLLDQIAKKGSTKLKPSQTNKVKVQPKTSECYDTIVKAVTSIKKYTLLRQP